LDSCRHVRLRCMAPMLLNFQCNDMERLRAPGHHTNISKMIVLPFFSIQGSHHYPPQLCFFSCGSCGRISMPPPARPHPFMGAPSVPSMVPEPSRPRHHPRFYGFQQGAVVGSTASSRPRPFSWVPFRDDFPEQPPTGNFRQAFQRTPPARKRFCSRRSRRQLCLSQKLGP
jgi:hypothetical protein